MKKKLLTERFQQLAGIKPLYTEQSDTDDYGRSISGKDKRTFVDPKDLTPAARAKKMLNKFKKGDIVIPNVGPHKGVKHEIIYDFGDGKYNIQPIGLRPNQIQYRLGATGAREDQLQMADDVNQSKVDITYTDPGFRFYKIEVDGKRLNREEGTEYLKDLGIVDDEGKDMEIPGSYDESILDKIVAQLKEKGIDANYNANFDPS